MTTLAELIRQGRPAPDHRPWPRATVDAERWRLAGQRLAEGDWTLLSLWGEAAAAHMALRDPQEGMIAVLSLDCTDRRFPSIGALHAPAIRLERTMNDLFGLAPQGAADERPWLDHGRWGHGHPLGDRSEAAAARPYEFLAAEGEGLHQIPVGPVHAGIIEPGHFRFTANGEAVVRLEQRLGYTHKGIDGLMMGADLERAAKLAGRVSGDSTVAYALAFARAAEAALEIAPPARAVWLRALMAEMERLANHFGDIGAICNDASFSVMQAHCQTLREQVLRAANTGFGHRLMRDRILPGGVAADLGSDGIAAIRALVAEARRQFPTLIKLYDNSASLQDRTVSTGVVKPELARRFGCGGYIGRASGRDFDTRRSLPYAPYDQLAFEVTVLTEGDVNARVWIRIREVEQSLALIEQILDRLPAGELRTALPGAGGEGMAMVEGFRGDILAWLRLGADGKVARCHLRDPSWFQWPLLEAAIEGNIVADFPLCNKSFNCSYSGHDL
ncbi:hydrogenase expression protein HypE [Hypericibacter adhaerens]|uniref:Hydrogenase expression protein HypE n=1 Tax=Hypericibacter adhaerens TaxID=2602016 RepID=A0A5J6N050_9PROT|nr:NADH-quinone oxidoreductase subunit C [Hypericibacter adhaerens]QEX22315.1 hydrogenase expression protein HypE [Hypericibacter adhaerens]